MTNFFKFLVVLAPVTVLVLYLAILHSQEVSTRMNIANKQFNQAVNCFEKDWANFDNPKYWKKKQKHPCTFGGLPCTTKATKRDRERRIRGCKRSCECDVKREG